MTLGKLLNHFKILCPHLENENNSHTDISVSFYDHYLSLIPFFKSPQHRIRSKKELNNGPEYHKSGFPLFLHYFA